MPHKVAHVLTGDVRGLKGRGGKLSYRGTRKSHYEMNSNHYETR